MGIVRFNYFENIDKSKCLRAPENMCFADAVHSEPHRVTLQATHKHDEVVAQIVSLHYRNLLI